ncbi:MAG: hypothetical protein RLY93_18440 [Sumerlaeia bacterium]
MENLLFQCREALGRPPRDPRSPTLQALALPTPLWAALTRDPLRLSAADAEILRQRGEVVWAAVVTANAALLAPKAGDRPAAVVTGLDPHYDGHILDLLDLAQVLVSLPSDDRGREDLRELGRRVSAKRRRGGRHALPEDLTDSRAVFFTDLLIHRASLPGGYLRDSWLPVLIDPTHETRAIAVLPQAYWPAELIELWMKDAPEE